MKIRGYLLFLLIVIGGTASIQYYNKQSKIENINSSLPENVKYNGDTYHATYVLNKKKD